MTLITTIADPLADSYVTLLEADTYLSTRPGFDTSTWEDLEEDTKEFCLTMATMVLDTMRFRGVKASLDQGRAFPRILPTDKALYTREDSYLGVSFDTWLDCTDYCTAEFLAAPIIPGAVKKAVVEIAFQVIHKHYLDLDPMEMEDGTTSFVGVGKLQVQFGASKNTDITKDFIEKSSISAISIVKFYLAPYLAGIRSRMV